MLKDLVDGNTVLGAILNWLVVVFWVVLIGGIILEYAGRQARRVWKAWTTDPDDDRRRL